MVPCPSRAHPARCRAPRGHPDSTGRFEGLCRGLSPPFLGLKEPGAEVCPRNPAGSSVPSRSDGSGPGAPTAPACRCEAAGGAFSPGSPLSPAARSEVGVPLPRGRREAEHGKFGEVSVASRPSPPGSARQPRARGLGGHNLRSMFYSRGGGGRVCRKIAHNRARASAPSHQWGGGPLPERCLGAARPGGGSGGGRADPVRSRVSQSRKFAPAAAVPEGPGPERGAGGGGRTRGELRLYGERGGIGVLIPRTGVVKFAGRQLNGAKCGKAGGWGEAGGCVRNKEQLSEANKRRRMGRSRESRGRAPRRGLELGL